MDQILTCSRFESVILIKLIEAYAFVHPDSDIGSFFDRQRDILRSAFSRGRIFQGRLPGTITEGAYAGLREALKHG